MDGDFKKKSNSKKAASILNWALLKQDTIKAPSDTGKPGPMGVPGTDTAFLSVHMTPDSEGPYTGVPAVVRR